MLPSQKFAQFSKMHHIGGASFDNQQFENTSMKVTEFVRFASDNGLVPHLTDVNTARSIFARSQNKDHDRGSFT